MQRSHRREAISIQLRIGHEIKVGDNYLLIVAPYQGYQDGDQKQAALPDDSSISSHHIGQTVPVELQTYFETSRLFLHHLPEIYSENYSDTDRSGSFLARFLALFESVFLPMKWTAEDFYVYLHGESAPPEMLSWLADWYGIPFDQNLLAEKTQREILRSLPNLIERRGTVSGLCELLHLYTGMQPAIDDGGNNFESVQPVIDDGANNVESIEPGRFTVAFEPGYTPGEPVRKLLQDLIDWYKPAHTRYELK